MGDCRFKKKSYFKPKLLVKWKWCNSKILGEFVQTHLLMSLIKSEPLKGLIQKCHRKSQTEIIGFFPHVLLHTSASICNQNCNNDPVCRTLADYVKYLLSL